MTIQRDVATHDGDDGRHLPDDTRHRIRRKGRELSVRVQQLDDVGNGGTILSFGDVGDGCLVRIHSRCLYGDALLSDDCDCGPELELAMDLIQAAGAGVLIYLEQEGRGSGLLAKARGLHYSEHVGVDTFTSYRHLDLPDDCRSYTGAARALRTRLGLTTVRLLTNNPDKVEDLRSADLTVERVPLITEPRSERARAYMESKRHVRGHWLPEFPGDVAPQVSPVATSPVTVPSTEVTPYETPPPSLPPQPGDPVRTDQPTDAAALATEPT